MNISKIRVCLVDNNGSPAWFCRINGKPFKRSATKFQTEEEFRKEIAKAATKSATKSNTQILVAEQEQPATKPDTNPPKNESVRSKVKFRWTMPKSNIKCRSIKSENNIQRSGDSFDIFSYEEE